MIEIIIVLSVGMALVKYISSQIEKNGETLYRKFTTRTCKLIPIEIDRLEYLISYCLKNYYIKNANRVADGDYVPKWKHENLLSAMEAQVEGYNVKDVQVIIDGHRYKVI